MDMLKLKTGNTSIGGSIIAALCIIIYLAALIQGSVRIYLSIENNRNLAEQEFSQIVNTALSTGTQGFMDDRFVQSMNNALTSSRTIEALIITGPGGEQAFEKQSGRAVTWHNNSPRFINRFDLSSQNHFMQLPILDIRTVTIRAVSTAFDYGEISNILKESLIIILIGFALAFFTMLLQLLMAKPKGEMIHVPVSEPAKKTPVKPKEPVTYDVEPGSGPKGLYSSRSNIGWEDYTIDRLDSELHRCSSTEKDLAFLLLEFADINNDALFKQAAEEAVSFFTSRDLIFEYGKKGISIILPGIGLDTAIIKSEKFYLRIMEKLFPADEQTTDEQNFNLKIGLSSRSGRLLNADRLMLEAKEALKKAKNDTDTSIIAFKSDPEKYRAFIAAQN
jgi:GGDEF domain-containing protein